MTHAEAIDITITQQRRPIAVGDLVQVTLGRGSIVRGTVLGIPAATGDCWKIQEQDGTLIYIQQFRTLARIPDENGMKRVDGWQIKSDIK